MKKLPDELMFLEHRNAIQKTTNARIDGKTVVITGGTSGVGLEALKRIAQNNVHVFVLARSIDKAKDIIDSIKMTSNATFDIIQADFSRLDDVRNAALEIKQKTSRIDILINCAGLHSTKKTYTQDGYETVFEVNHLSSFLFTYLLLDVLKASSPSRILNINSEGHRFNGLNIDDLNWNKRIYTGLRGYGASKTAQLLCTWELHDQLINSGVSINAMHPGDVKTNIGQNNGLLYRIFSKLVIQRILKDPTISGDAIYYLIADPSLNDVSGQYFNLTHIAIPAKHALDREMGKRIYKKTLKLCNLE
jgi:NAD(P)-dependent dehydrogenase (short-subunit alcohol dehydrogenase family)